MQGRLNGIGVSEMTNEEKSKKIKRADDAHNKGFNCCQAVLSAFTEETGMTDKQALAIGGGFGGGLRHGDVCGAVSGAVMVLSMTHPYTNSDDIDSKRRIALLTKEFHKRFLEKFGVLTCRELLGRDISDDTEFSAAKAAGKLGKCPTFIAGATEIVCDMLDKEKL